MESAAEMCGLVATTLEGRVVEDEAAVPLLGVSVRARGTRTACRVVVTQRYRNDEPEPVEAVYVFPLEAGAAVCAFTVTVDGRRLVGEVRDRDEAFDRYDDALAEGHGAFLLDEERPDVFVASVGNLLPGQEVEVEISYLAELESHGDSVRLRIPGTVSPRYVPSHRMSFEGLEDAERISPRLAQSVPYRLDLEVELDLLSPVRSVESPSHRVRTVLDGERVRVSLAGDDTALDRDFVLVATFADPFAPASRMVATAGGERFVLAAFRSGEEAHPRRPVEAVFLVDCSGSMGGPAIEDARRTLRLCLRSLLPGDRFDIVRFGSVWRPLFGEPVPYDDRSLRKADALAASMTADLGGTEILGALRSVLERRVEEGVGRSVVLLTDGEVSDEDEVIALAGAHRRTTRCLTFGLGHGASEHLVRGVARASGGAAEMIAPGESIEDKVLRHVARLGRPRADEVKLEWQGVEVADVTPQRLPALAPGETVTLFARVTAGAAGTARLVLRTGERTETLTTAFREEGTDDLVPLLWARRRIAELEDDAAWAGRAGSAQASRRRRSEPRRRARIREELVRLGTTYGLMSTATSYVVVDERPGDRRAGGARLRRVPTLLTRGWGGMEVEEFCVELSADECLSASPVPRDRPGRELADHQYRLSIDLGADEAGRELSHDATEIALLLSSFPSAPGPRGAAARSAESADHELLLRQTAGGWWRLEGALARRCGVELAVLRGIADSCGHPEGRRVLATLIVLLLVERGELEVEEAWQHIIGKARSWLLHATVGRKAPGGVGWEEWARSRLP